MSDMPFVEPFPFAFEDEKLWENCTPPTILEAGLERPGRVATPDDVDAASHFTALVPRS